MKIECNKCEGFGFVTDSLPLKHDADMGDNVDYRCVSVKLLCQICNGLGFIDCDDERGIEKDKVENDLVEYADRLFYQCEETEVVDITTKTQFKIEALIGVCDYMGLSQRCRYVLMEIHRDLGE